MSVEREKKEKQVKELGNIFKKHDTFYMLDFFNMPVAQTTELRKRMRENSYSFKVIKNRLALRAWMEDFPEELKACFRGPTAIAYTSDDPIGLARLLKDFSSEYKVLSIKAGLLEGQFLAQEKFGEISSLTSREDLLAKMGFIISFSLIKLLRTWQAPLFSLGSMLSQLKTKK